MSSTVSAGVSSVQYYIQSGTTSYALGSAVTPSGGTANLGSVAISSTGLGTLTSGSTYQVYALGKTTAGTSEKGPSVSFVADAAPTVTAPSATWSNTVSGVNYVYGTTIVPQLSTTVSSNAASVRYYIKTGSGAAVTLGSAVTPSGGTATLTATSYTMTDGTAYTVYAVATDAAGNTTQSTATSFTADAAPTDENTVLAANQTVKDDATVTLDAAPAVTGETVWLAPAGTTTFTTGSTMTKSTTNTITAPTTDGTYHAYVVDAAGNVSAASTDTVIADSTAPSKPGAQTVFAAAGSGLAVDWTASTDSGSGVAGYNVYYSTSASGPWTKANSNSTLISSSSTEYHITDGTYTPSPGPLASGTKYYVYVSAVDNVGNESAAPTTSSASGTASKQ